LQTACGRWRNKKIVDYLENSYISRCKSPLRTTVILLGPTNGGKTFVFDHLIGHAAKKSDNPPPEGKKGVNPLATDGFSMRQLTHTAKGKKFSFNVWEFAGDPLFRPACTFFFHDQRVIYMLIFNILAPQECKFEVYLDMIRSKAPTAPIIVLGTHSDNPRFNDKYLDSTKGRIEKKYTEQYNLTEFTNIDVFRSNSVLSLKNLLCKYALQQPHTTILAPPSFYDVANLLNKLREGKVAISHATPNPSVMEVVSLSWTDYVNLILSNRVKVTLRELKEITIMLHASGYIIYFGDNFSSSNERWGDEGVIMRLFETRVILNIQMLIKGISSQVKEVNEQKLKGKDGSVTSRSFGPLSATPSTSRPGTSVSLTRSSSSSSKGEIKMEDITVYFPNIEQWLYSK